MTICFSCVKQIATMSGTKVKFGLQRRQEQEVAMNSVND